MYLDWILLVPLIGINPHLPVDLLSALSMSVQPFLLPLLIMLFLTFLKVCDGSIMKIILSDGFVGHGANILSVTRLLFWKCILKNDRLFTAQSIQTYFTSKL